MAKKSEKRQRTDAIRARVTPAEKTKFIRRCENAGLSTGDYIRSKCLDEKPLRAIRKISIDTQLVLELLHQLSRYGNNLNQIAHKLNRSGVVNSTDLELLSEVKCMILEIRTILRKELGYDSQR